MIADGKAALSCQRVFCHPEERSDEGSLEGVPSGNEILRGACPERTERLEAVRADPSLRSEPALELESDARSGKHRSFAALRMTGRYGEGMTREGEGLWVTRYTLGVAVTRNSAAERSCEAPGIEASISSFPAPEGEGGKVTVSIDAIR